jgi:hypothetical protein
MAQGRAEREKLAAMPAQQIAALEAIVVPSLMRTTLPSGPRLLREDGSLDYAALVSAETTFQGLPEALMDWIAEGVRGDWFLLNS